MEGGAKAKEDFAQNRAPKIKLGAIRGATVETAHFGALLDVRPSAIQSCLSGLQLAHVLVRRKMTFHLMEHTRLGGAKGYSGFLSWQYECQGHMIELVSGKNAPCDACDMCTLRNCVGSGRASVVRGKCGGRDRECQCKPGVTSGPR